MSGNLPDGGAVFAPAYGPVRRTIEYGLFYFVVDRCTEVLAALLSELPPVASHVSTVRTASAVALWLMLAVVVGAEAWRQYSANPWDPADLEPLRPSRRDLAVAGGAVAVGAPIAARGWTTVARLTEDVGAALAAGQEVASHVSSNAELPTKAAGLLGTDLGTVVAFGIGFVLLTYGLDRLLVGLVRELQYRRHARTV